MTPRLGLRPLAAAQGGDCCPVPGAAVREPATRAGLGAAGARRAAPGRRQEALSGRFGLGARRCAAALPARPPGSGGRAPAPPPARPPRSLPSHGAEARSGGPVAAASSPQPGHGGGRASAARRLALVVVLLLLFLRRRRLRAVGRSRSRAGAAAAGPPAQQQALHRPQALRAQVSSGRDAAPRFSRRVPGPARCGRTAGSACPACPRSERRSHAAHHRARCRVCSPSVQLFLARRVPVAGGRAVGRPSSRLEHPTQCSPKGRGAAWQPPPAHRLSAPASTRSAGTGHWRGC